MVPSRFTLALALAPLLAGPPDMALAQAMPADVGPGRIAWFDLATTDLAKSRAFYGELFGWQFTPVEGTDLAVEIVSRGESIGTLRVAIALAIEPGGHPIGLYDRSPLP